MQCLNNVDYRVWQLQILQTLRLSIVYADSAVPTACSYITCKNAETLHLNDTTRSEYLLCVSLITYMCSYTCIYMYFTLKIQFNHDKMKLEM